MTPPLEATATVDAVDLSPVERILAKGRWKATLAMLGPAFVASIAYVDPGNFATNVRAGALMLVIAPCTRAWLLLFVGAVRSEMVMLALESVTRTVTRICS